MGDANRSGGMKFEWDLWPNFLTGDISFEVESSVDSGRYVQEIPFVVCGDIPMTDHEIDNH